MAIEVYTNKNTQNKKIKKISLYDIKDNPNNRREMDEEYINNLAATIRELGLQNPLQVYETEDGEFMLLGGHKRLKACLQNCEMYGMDEEVECIIYDSPEDLNDEIAKVIISNSIHESKEDAINAIKQAEELWFQLPKEKRKGNKRDYIARLVGKSPRTVTNYLNEIDKERYPEQKEEKKKEKKKKTDKQLVKEIKKLTEQLQKQTIAYKSLSNRILEAIEELV